MRIYLDNAAATPMDQEVMREMHAVMEHQYGNPSSLHANGRQARTTIEEARKTIAHLLKASPSEIFFTSGGTEANNMAIRGGVIDNHIQHAITAKTEHPAVIHTLESLARDGLIKLSFVEVDKFGHINFEQLEQLLAKEDRSFVSLMHANNEIGTLTDLEKLGTLCHAYNAIFHCDTVQTLGHYPHDLSKLKIHFLVCAAHKFHGPKGIGFIYINSKVKINPLLFGGSQERNMRGGTENIYGIVGLAKALTIAYTDMERQHQYIQGLKDYMMQELLCKLPGIVEFNGETHPQKSLYTVLNVSFPDTYMADVLLWNLDIAGISVSAGSACSSGTHVGSHVLKALGADQKRPSIRFSFSKYNTKQEIDQVINTLKKVFQKNE